MMRLNKKILLGAAIAVASAQQAVAVPFAPSDARAMGMGGVGVASSEIASAPRYNPALLANTREDDHFGLKFPQFSVIVADDDGFIDSVEAFDEEDEFGNSNIDNLSAALDAANNGGISAIENAANALNSDDNASDLSDAADALTATIDALRGSVISTEGAATPDSDLYTYSNLIANDVENLNSKALRLNAGGNIALAIPSKKFSLALSTGAQVVFSGRVINLESDTDLMRNYATATDRYLTTVADLEGALSAAIDAKEALEADLANTQLQNEASAAADELDAAQAALDDFSYGGTAGEGDTVIFQDGALVETNTDLSAEIEMVGVAIADIGLTAARTFNIKGHDISFGVTPKLQMVTIFDYKQQLDSEDEFDGDTITENTEEYSAFNLDLGAAYQFGIEKQWQAGITIQNLLGGEYESYQYVNSNGAEGSMVTISPMMRAGISHQTSWSKVAFDLDLTENDPVAFEDPTQYAAIGAEFNLFRTLQLRAGYRSNLAGTDQDIVTAGIGLSPFAIHLDLGVMANASDPEKEAGIALEFGVEF
ncbi:conjugal transfer protein TraF [Oceaniserpentilla sp. 4NH20-0058]|uniref:conjugal transfer protein TraF n=1 Tax=Oceaniserpentilla sp. 4NH20-0058 TaxID=3127660 RepID=UPI003108E195